jgi:hypothetical protein
MRMKKIQLQRVKTLKIKPLFYLSFSRRCFKNTDPTAHIISYTLMMNDDVFDHYLAHYHYLTSSQILFFIFSPRRHQRRRQQYEVFQKIFYETSLNNTKMILSITSVRNNRMFQFIDTRHSTFTFCFVFTSF